MRRDPVASARVEEAMLPIAATSRNARRPAGMMLRPISVRTGSAGGPEDGQAQGAFQGADAAGQGGLGNAEDIRGGRE